MNKHTPGYWIAADHGDYADYGGDSIVILGRSGQVRTAVVQGRNDKETRANARLIAASPDLLDVAHYVLAHATIETPEELLEKARKAIAKAVEMPASADPGSTHPMIDKTDKELLEFAAKAAGMDYLLWTPGSAPIVPKEHMTSECLIAGKICWNPLEYDGDALRLACDLGLHVSPIARTSSGKACSASGFGPCQRLSEVADPSIDTISATRRAIVLAAAEIGRAMQ